MSLLAIKGTYENGQIILNEPVPIQTTYSVVITFLEEKIKPISTNEWDDWFSALTQFTDDFMANGRNQPTIQERDWSVFE